MSDRPISRLECIACHATYPTDRRSFRCACGDLLEVQHDLEAVQRAHGDLKERFARRLGTLDPDRPHDASGVWRYRELILPELPEAAIVSLPEGSTPLYRREAVERYVGAREVRIKHEGENPTLSFKDRGMTAGVSWARQIGATLVACASTGDTSAAMACYAAAAGLPAAVLLPHEKVSPEQLAQPICYGARVLALETDFDGCMAVVRELTADGRVYLLNSMNPFRIEGQKAIGIEALHQLGWRAPDWFVIPVGNAGNISALGKGLLELQRLGLIDRLPRVAGVQAAAADPLYQAYSEGFTRRVRVTARPTVASAIRIGDPVSFDKARAVVQRLDGVMTEVTDEQALEAMAVVDAAGVHVCPNTAVAVAGARRLCAEGVIAADASMVVIATAHGGKFSGAAVGYHAGPAPAGVARPHRNPPRVIAPTLEAVREALELD
jgi:threonine synthase